MDNLARLPPELISQISTLLDNDSLFALRTTNRYSNEATFSHFGHRCFRKKGFLISTPSLNVLRSIASHGRLSQCVQHVWFNPDLYTNVVPRCSPEAGAAAVAAAAEPPHHKDRTDDEEDDDSDPTERYELYRRSMADHQTLLHTSALARRLLFVFRRLPNLQAVGMRRSQDHAPWGWGRLRDAIGEDPRVLGDSPPEKQRDLSGPSALFVAIIRAAAAAAAAPRTSSIPGSQSQHGDDDDDDADTDDTTTTITSPLRLRRLYTDAVELDNIPPANLGAETLHFALADLLYLEINATLSRRGPEPAAQQATSLDFGSGLARVLQACAPRLLELGLQIFPDVKQQRPGGTVAAAQGRRGERWRESYSFLTFARLVADADAGTAAAARLTRLKLDKITSSAELLEAFLAPSAGVLQSLKMRHVRLLSAGEEEEEGAAASLRHRPWQRVFEMLHARCTALSSLLLYQLKHERGGVSFSSVGPGAREVVQHDDDDDDDYGDGAYAFADVGAPAGEMFAGFEDVALEARGREAVEARLAAVTEGHWYLRKHVFTYRMDDGMWDTDTSDEEW